MPITPVNALRVSKHQIPAYKGIPNTSIQGKPLMIYHSAFTKSSAASIKNHLRSVGVVSPQWEYTMFTETHFHSTTHEVLSIASGSAKCCFGGEQNEGRVEPVLEEGDVVIVRIMKGRKKLKHVHLVEEVINQVRNRFPPKISDIKKNIDALMEKDYIERLDNDELAYIA